MKNENKYSDMIDVMNSLHGYVLVVSSESNSGSSTKLAKEMLHPLFLIFGGDELIATRARG